MANDEYVLSQTTDAFERERLNLLERVADPVSQRHLVVLGIQRGRCYLEVGAGHGSVARWLAEQVGPQGKVVATDINPRFLTEIELHISTPIPESATNPKPPSRVRISVAGRCVSRKERAPRASMAAGRLLAEFQGSEGNRIMIGSKRSR